MPLQRAYAKRGLVKLERNESNLLYVPSSLPFTSQYIVLLQYDIG
jgi:hypothetical protein